MRMGAAFLLTADQLLLCAVALSAVMMPVALSELAGLHTLLGIAIIAMRMLLILRKGADQFPVHRKAAVAVVVTIAFRRIAAQNLVLLPAGICMAMSLCFRFAAGQLFLAEGIARLAVGMPRLFPCGDMIAFIGMDMLTSLG